MHTRVQIASVLFALLLLVAVFELTRRRYLRERYALVWMSAALVLLVLAIWKSLLNTVSKAVGIYYPPNAFFVIAFAFLLFLLLHFSAVVSRMSDRTRLLAQRLALLEERERSREGGSMAGEPALTEVEAQRELVAGHRSGPLEERPEPVTRAGSSRLTSMTTRAGDER